MSKRVEKPGCPLCFPLKPHCSFCLFIEAARETKPQPKYQRAYASQPLSLLQQRALFEQSKSVLLSNLARIEVCLADFTQAMDTRIERTKAYRDFVVDQLQTWKEELSRDISESVAEVEAVLWGSNADMKAKYSFPLLCNAAESFKIVRYVESNKATKTRKLFAARFCPLRLPDLGPECQAFLPIPEPDQPTQLIPRLKERHIKYIDAETKLTKTSATLQKRLDVNEASIWVTVDTSRVLLCVANPRLAHSAAEMVYLDGRVETCPDLHFSHSRGGLVVWKAAVFVFGGSANRDGRTAERLSLSLSHWTRLPDMHEAHSYFTPLLWREAIYLCSGRTVEVFDSFEFRILYLVVPLGCYGCVSITQGKDLVIFSSECSIVLSVSSDDRVPVVSVRDSYILRIPVWCTAPVRVKHALVYVTLYEVTTCEIRHKR